jgi:lipopolysaccharide export system protein LptA
MSQTGKGFLVLVLFFLLFSLLSAEAQDKKGKAKVANKKPKAEGGFGLMSSRSPIEITSDALEANQKENVVTFSGNVIAKQEEMTIYTNKLVVNYDPETKKIGEIQALGNVKVVMGDRRATGQKATFFQNENKLILEGDAVIREGDNVIRGERVIYYMDEERSVVEPSKGGRVTTTISPPKKD